MPKQLPKTSKKTRRSRGFLRSIRAKTAAIFLVIGASFTGAGYLVYSVFEKVGTDMSGLTETQLPRLELSAEITAGAINTKNQMIELLLADDLSTLENIRAQIGTTKEKFETQLTNLDASEREEMESAITEVTEALQRLSDTKHDEVEGTAQIEAQVLKLQNVSQSLQRKMTLLANAAYTKLSRKGWTVARAIDHEITALIDDEFAFEQVLLITRAEMNLLAGSAVALSLSQDPVVKSALREMALTSQDRLETLLEAIGTREQNLIDVTVLADAVTTLTTVVRQGTVSSIGLMRTAIDAHHQADQVLSTAIEVLEAKSAIRAEHVKAENKDAVVSLLQNEVISLNRILVTTNAISGYQVGVLGVVAAETSADVDAAQVNMAEAMNTIDLYKRFELDVLDEEYEALQALNHPETGIVSLKKRVLAANEREHQAMTETAAAVSKISQISNSLSLQVRNGIGTMAADISDEMKEVEKYMTALVATVAGIFVVSLLLMQLWVSRPLKRISTATERLASGNREPITGFDRASSEIFAIAQSLSVFRDGIVEHEARNAEAERTRQAHQEEQDVAVRALAEGLSRLAQGDLGARLDTPLAEGYEQLRTDFNNSVTTLNETIGQAVDAAASLLGGAGEISQASDDLSHRTESQAATLEETAAALDELTMSVKAAAESARNVERTVSDARDQAAESEAVVKSAVGAMTEIEQSSNHISQIIGVIDDIAFQTNLLALNAGVEAARAGEAGRGFAVVASEVRALAQRSSDAAMEIKTLISASSTQVESGVDLVGKAGGALQKIMERVNAISQLVSQIATGAEEQSLGLNEINVGMSQLDQVTQQNAAMVEEATAASQLLKSDASNLSGLMSQFSTEPKTASEHSDTTVHVAA